MIAAGIFCKLQRTFDKILELHNSVSVCHRILHSLVIELYNVFNGIYSTPNIMKDVFPSKHFSIIRPIMNKYIISKLINQYKETPSHY